mgnify:CR=1 FL=1
MKNIELKIFLDDFKDINFILKKIGAKYKGKFHQVDVYYWCKGGRLKLRKIDGQNFELIFYKRSDSNHSRLSDYQIFSIPKKRIKPIKSILNKVYGEKNIVRKERSLWIYKHTRIHFDNVVKLGKFLELETVMEKINFKQAMKEYDKIVKMLNLSKYKIYNKSYSDLLLKEQVLV